jgi:hypothetical protein
VNADDGFVRRDLVEFSFGIAAVWRRAHPSP